MLENLQQHENIDIYKQAIEIIEKYFDDVRVIFTYFIEIFITKHGHILNLLSHLSMSFPGG